LKITRNFSEEHAIYCSEDHIVGCWAGNSVKNLQRAIEIAKNLHGCDIYTENLPHQEQIPSDLLRMAYLFRDGEGCAIWGCDKRGNCLITWELKGGYVGEAIMTTDKAREFFRSLGTLCGIEL
jgi:hypothetical protein